MTGLIKCGYCSRALVVIPYKKKGEEIVRKYLRCSGRDQELCDKTVRFKIDEIEDEVQIQLIKLLKGCKDLPVEPPKVNYEEQKELIQIKDKINNLMGVLSSGEASSLTIKHVNVELEKLSAQKEELEKKLAPEYMPISLPEKIDFEELSFGEKKMIANSYIDRVFVYDDHIRIRWKI